MLLAITHISHITTDDQGGEWGQVFGTGESTFNCSRSARRRARVFRYFSQNDAR